VLSNSIQQLSDHTLTLCLLSEMADRKCTHAHWRQCVKAECVILLTYWSTLVWRLFLI